MAIPGWWANANQNAKTSNPASTWSMPYTRMASGSCRYPSPTLLTWLWQRWELEVAHREMKSGLGVGEIQCWNKCAAVLSVQWSVWFYAILIFAGYRTWGLRQGPPALGRWYHARRWSITTLLRSFRAAFWQNPEFRSLLVPIYRTTGPILTLGSSSTPPPPPLPQEFDGKLNANRACNTLLNSQTSGRTGEG